MVLTALFWMFIVTAGIEILYLLFISRIPGHRDVRLSEPEGTSIVIAIHNEAENLRNNLPGILNQDHPDLEVIVVDHGSTDESAEVLKELTHERLIVLHVPRDREGKKFALQVGVHAASKPIILLTDGDCRAASDQWARAMSGSFTPGIEIVLGYAPLEGGSGWLARFSRMETIDTAARYLAFALNGIPYMGVGRNLAYRKEIFADADLESDADLPGGDDDLLVNQLSEKSNTTVCLDPDSYMTSTIASDWGGWFRQKTRHYAAGGRYRTVHKFLLGLLAVSHFLFYVCFALLLALGAELDLVLDLFFIRVGIQLIVLYRVMEKLRERGFLWFVLVFDILFPLIQLVFIPTLMGRKKKSWN
jgi:glycosyltransferase involved in cell wall biosynthesis